MTEVKVNGVSIYYEVTGNGQSFVFLHGGGMDSSSWHSQTAYFSKRYQVITFDIRGHGRSEFPDGGYSVGDCVEDLHQLLDYLSVQRTYLAGFSIGGYMALSFTLHYPERIDALILAGSNSGPIIETVVMKSEATADRIRLTQGIDSAMKFMKVREANMARPDLTDRLSEITKPVLIVVGDQDGATPLHISEDMHGRIENSQMAVLTNCGHRCNQEQPDTFNSIVSDFLQKVEAA